MYEYIKGKFINKYSSDKGYFAVVEVNNIGYLTEIMERDYINIEDVQDIKLYTVLIHREDKMSLCGFLKKEDRDVFNILTSVSGVGIKMALTLLNSFKVTDLVGFVIDGNYKQLTNAKGVGPKLAQKIILELKDKFNSYKESKPEIKIEGSKNISSENIEDATMVMLSLGYEKNEVNNAIVKALTKLPEKSSAEDILKESLQILALN